MDLKKADFILAVKVIPKASKSEIVGWENDSLKVRLKAVPEKGEANEELIAFMSKSLKIPQSRIELVRGHTSRHKQLRFTFQNEDERTSVLNFLSSK